MRLRPAIPELGRLSTDSKDRSCSSASCFPETTLTFCHAFGSGVLLTGLWDDVLGQHFNSTLGNGREGARDIPKADWVVWVLACIKGINGGAIS